MCALMILALAITMPDSSTRNVQATEATIASAMRSETSCGDAEEASQVLTHFDAAGRPRHIGSDA